MATEQLAFQFDLSEPSGGEGTGAPGALGSSALGGAVGVAGQSFSLDAPSKLDAPSSVDPAGGSPIKFDSVDNPFSSTSQESSLLGQQKGASSSGGAEGKQEDNEDESSSQQQNKKRSKQFGGFTNFGDLSGEISDDDLPNLEKVEEPPILESIVHVPKIGEPVKLDFGAFYNNSAISFSGSFGAPNTSTDATPEEAPTPSISFSEVPPQNTSSPPVDLTQNSTPSVESFSFSDPSSNFSFADHTNPFSSTASVPADDNPSSDTIAGVPLFDDTSGDQFRFSGSFADLSNPSQQEEQEEASNMTAGEIWKFVDDDLPNEGDGDGPPNYFAPPTASAMAMEMAAAGASGIGSAGSGLGAAPRASDDGGRPRRKIVRGKRTGTAINSHDYNKLFQGMETLGIYDEEEEATDEEADNYGDAFLGSLETGFQADVSGNESDKDSEEEVLPELEWEETTETTTQKQNQNSSKQQKSEKR